jgi:hypothetical protein
MRHPLRLAVAAAAGLTLVATGCSGTSNEDAFRSGIEEGFEQAGIDVTDEQADCYTDAVLDAIGGEKRLDELEDEFDTIDDLPADVREELADAGVAALEACDIDIRGAVG